MRKVIFLLAAGLFPITQPASGNPEAVKDAVIKICLAFAHEAQETHWQSRLSYTDTVDELELGKNPYCESVRLSILEADKHGFKIRGESASSAWSVDHQKNLRKLR